MTLSCVELPQLPRNSLNRQSYLPCGKIWKASLVFFHCPRPTRLPENYVGLLIRQSLSQLCSSSNCPNSPTVRNKESVRGLWRGKQFLLPAAVFGTRSTRRREITTSQILVDVSQCKSRTLDKMASVKMAHVWNVRVVNEESSDVCIVTLPIVAWARRTICVIATNGGNRRVKSKCRNTIFQGWYFSLEETMLSRAVLSFFSF